MTTNKSLSYELVAASICLFNISINKEKNTVRRLC